MVKFKNKEQQTNFKPLCVYFSLNFKHWGDSGFDLLDQGVRSLDTYIMYNLDEDERWCTFVTI